MPGASKKRLAARKAKADMLKRSSDRSQGGSSDMGGGSDQGPPEEEGFDDKETGTMIKGERSGTIIAAAG